MLIYEPTNATCWKKMKMQTARQAKKKHFQMMRKMHYDEGLNIKLARQLLARELEEDEDEDEEMTDDTEDLREETEEITVDPPQEADSLES
ncbi:hypothetical protein CHARACLAT_028130 [Characodon lateralis]|uniref:Uncharacterized protein n=1 Tax=Characodon lateralis TaxID=208331 RepID=A0ABU7ENI9_9TELE|nr:hypothetical protein [Characodon lateralis]